MGWYYLLSIRAKLLLGFGVVILLTIVVSATSLFSMQRTRSVADYMQWSLTERYSLVDDISLMTVNLQEEYIVFVNTYRRNPQVLGEIEQKINQFVASVQPLLPDRFPQEISALKRDTELLNNLFRNKIKPLTLENDVTSAALTYVDEALPLFSEINANLKQIREKQIADVLAQAELAASPGPMFLVLFMSVVIFVISILIALFTAAYSKNAIMRLIGYVSTIEGRDLSQKITVRNKDEFGQLAQSVENLRAQQNAIMTEIGNIADIAKDTLTNMRHDMSKLSADAQETENRSLTAAAASHQMAETTREISSNCEHVANLSAESSKITSDGIVKAKGSIKEINDQSLKTKEDSKQIEAMINQSRNISSIVGTIDDIAAQTNLLALNAAIEAARAGEAGRGFAVVADEVRALATRTTSSTNEISSMMTLIEDDAKNASDSMTRSVADMESIATETAALEQVFNDILDHVNEVNTQVTQIAAAVEQQSTATAEISSHIQSLTDGSQAVARVAGETHDALVACADNIEQLHSRIRSFKL